MTLGWSDLLDPSECVINRDGRHRRELTRIDDLVTSILQRGQIQPIVIQRGTKVLIAGERRLTAFLRINETDEKRLIRVVYSDEVDPSELTALEFEENVKRVDLPWKDNCLAV